MGQLEPKWATNNSFTPEGQLHRWVSVLTHQEGETRLSLTLSAVTSENKKFLFSLLRSHSVGTRIAQFATALSSRAGETILYLWEWMVRQVREVGHHRVAALWPCCFWVVRVCVADPDSWAQTGLAVLQNGHEKSIQAAADTQSFPFHQLNFSLWGKWFVGWNTYQTILAY